MNTIKANNVLPLLVLGAVCLCSPLATSQVSKKGISQKGASQKEDGSRWRMSVKAGKLRAISVKDRGRHGRRKTFWYVILDVKNNTGKTRKLDLAARADVPQVKNKPSTSLGLYPEVTKAIARKERRRGLVNLFMASGDIDAGATRAIVVVFGRLSTRANHIDVRIRGLTNLLYRDGKSYFLENTELSLPYHRIGDEFDIRRQEVRQKRQRWITIGMTKVRG